MRDRHKAAALAAVLLFTLATLALTTLGLCGASHAQLQRVHSAGMAAGHALCLASQEGQP